MPQQIVQEINYDDDSSWGDLEDSYTLSLERGYSFCSSISDASSAFLSLYIEDEIIEEWIEEEYYSNSELYNDDAVTLPSCAGEPSHEDETYVSLDYEVASDRDLECRNLEKEASGENYKSREGKMQNGARKSAKKNKKYSRPAFLRSLSTLSRIGKSSFRKKPKQFTNAAA